VDYNLILKYFISKLTLCNAIAKKIITTEEAGGRPQRSAIDEAVSTTILYKTIKLQHTSGGVMYNDAKACFDRIVENLSNIACAQAGAPHNVLKIHSKCLHDAQYIIKHKYGLSKRFNQHNNPKPFLGVGQGAGDSSTRWGFLSDLIIKAYRHKSHSAGLYSSISKIYTDKRVQAFVDDSRLFLITPDNNGASVQTYLQEDIQLWERLLHQTGAKLELAKCKFFIIHWEMDVHGNLTSTKL
jgi:hypothetical protein